MKQIAYPAGMREVAAQLGCPLPSHARFGADLVLDPSARPKTLSFQVPATKPKVFTSVPAQSVFTAPPRSSVPSTGVAVADPAALRARLASAPNTNKALALPANIDPKTAIAAMDRLRALPAAQPAIDRTMQIASVPSELQLDMSPGVIAAIERAAAALDAARQIRETTGTPPSQPLVPIQTADQSAAVSSAAASTVALTDADLEALAAATQQMVESARHHGPIERFLDWLKKVLT